MNFWLSFWVGLFIFVLALINKKLAALFTVIGFVSFMLTVMTGLVSVSADPNTVNNVTTNVVNQSANMMFDEIVGTYLVGALFGWTAPIIKGVIRSFSRSRY
jgi:hypothetical protein